MDTAFVITQFKRQLTMQGYAPKTIECYRGYLTYFEDYLKKHAVNSLRQVNHSMILDFQSQIMQQPHATETKALMIRSVKRLFEYLTANHRLLINPTEGVIETNRKHRKLPPVLTIDEMQRLLAQPNLSLPSQVRNRAIMEVLYSTAIRLDELIHLEVYHVDLQDKVLYVRRGKGSRQRVVPLGNTAIFYLNEYLVHIRPGYVKKDAKEQKLFLTVSGKPLSPNSIRYFLRNYRNAAKIKKQVSPHTFRRTCATHMLQQGADIRYVQKLLGHRYLRTTQIYTRIVPIDIKKIHIKTHPGVKKRNEN